MITGWLTVNATSGSAGAGGQTGPVVDPVVAQQDLAQPVPGVGPVGDQVSAGPAQIPLRRLAPARTSTAIPITYLRPSWHPVHDRSPSALSCRDETLMHRRSFRAHTRTRLSRRRRAGRPGRRGTAPARRGGPGPTIRSTVRSC